MTFIIGDIAYAAPSDLTAEIRDFLTEKARERIAEIEAKLDACETVMAALTAKLST